ncbi:MAG: CHC2 zinc finger domain-containing protein [Chloroflexota bacterium]
MSRILVSVTPGGPRSDAGSRIDTETLRREHPIADLVASYGIELRRVGSAMVGRCPFHQDGGHPNFHVYPSGRWICYRCDQRGDVIGFVQQIEHLTFREAAIRLGSGPVHSPRRVLRPRGSTSHCRSFSRRAEAIWGPIEYQVLAAATDLYANRLLADPLALAYMDGRGFPRDLLERHRVGFAAGDELVPYLRWRGLPVGAAVRTGLLGDDGREFLAGRIILPELREGRPVWLIGRVVQTPDRQPLAPGPSYLGLPGSKPLFGWNEALRDRRGVCVVEGPMDLLALRLWGVPGLALIGNSPRADQLALLEQFERLYVTLDQDAAGDAGAARLAAHLGHRVARVLLPSGIKDVGELAALPNGNELFCAAILRASGRTTNA